MRSIHARAAAVAVLMTLAAGVAAVGGEDGRYLLACERCGNSGASLEVLAK